MQGLDKLVTPIIKTPKGVYYRSRNPARVTRLAACWETSRCALTISSTAEQRAVNSKVPGSNPGWSAIGIIKPVGAVDKPFKILPLSRQSQKSGVRRARESEVGRLA